MSSAAKLRRFGRGTAVVATAAMVMTAFGPAAFASWDDDPSTTAVEKWPAMGTTDQGNYGTIGIADTGVPVVATDGDLPDPRDVGTVWPSTENLNPTPASQPTETADENQGATLVWAGKTEQAIADVRLTLPNRFASGDVIDLILTDRSSTETTNGNTNADAGRAVGFSSNPTVSVDADPKIGNLDGEGWAIDTGIADPAGVAGVDDTVYPAGTQVSADTDAVTSPADSLIRVSNTETGAASWAAHRDSEDVAGDSADVLAQKLRMRTKPGVAPEFNLELGADAGAQGKNRIRLIAKSAATGDPNAMWVLTLKDLKVDLGANVTPGELRLTPFATSFVAGGNSEPSPWFANNHKENVGSLIPAGARGDSGNAREIGIYTVPAYVSPVTITASSLGIIADTSPQPLGDVTLAETAPYSLGNGQYRMTLTGAIANSEDPASIKITVNNGGTTETATVNSIVNSASGTADSVTVTFTLANADNTKTSSLVVSGMNIQSRNSTPRALTVALNGGTINGAGNEGGPYWLTPAGNSSLSIPATPTYAAVHPDTWFVGENGAAEANRAPSATASATTYEIDFGTPTGLTSIATDPTAGLNATVPATGTLTVSVPRAATSGNVAVNTATVTGLTGVTNVQNAAVSGLGAVTVTFDYGGATFTAVIPALGAAPGAATTASGTVPFVGIAGGGLVAPTGANIPDSVNQLDIMADGPIAELMLRGSAQAAVSAIGGNNRYETARKIAREWSPLGDEVILASGQNYPDALSSGFLSQRLGAPIILTMKDSVPADTMESIRERGVRKVYIIGGPEAVSQGVADKLLATPSYMWSDSAKNLVPRGGNLEVVRLGGTSRYSTNALVNMYAAALNTGIPVVGTTSPAFGSPNKTTAMLARGDNFADALTANVLTSGRNTGEFIRSGSQGTTNYILGTTSGGATVVLGDLAAIGAGSYSFAETTTGSGIYNLLRGTTVVATQAATNTASFNLAGGGVISTSAAIAAGNASSTFTVVAQTVGATGDWVPRLENLNALPVILTPQGELGDQAKSELNTLHIGHVLVIGGSDVIPDSVVTAVDGLDITTRRLGGTDRYDTARVVNEYAWTSATPSSTNTTPGLGFDGGVTTVSGTRYGLAEAFLANGLKFPDALVAGPWVSRRHDAMVLTWVDSLPEPTKKFLSDNAARLDRAVGLGLGAAVSTKVIEEANRLVAAR